MSQSPRLVLEDTAMVVELCNKSNSVDVLASESKQKRDRKDLVSVLESGDRRIIRWLPELAKSGVNIRIKVLDIVVFFCLDLFKGHGDRLNRSNHNRSQMCLMKLVKVA
jgi:hypothetical protein